MGGRWANSYARDPEKVQSDFIEGLVSMKRARSEYAVVFMGDNYEIDQGEPTTWRPVRERVTPSG